MGFNRKLSLQWRVFVMVLGLGSGAVHAGPPLICHPFEIVGNRGTPHMFPYFFLIAPSSGVGSISSTATVLLSWAASLKR